MGRTHDVGRRLAARFGCVATAGPLSLLAHEPTLIVEAASPAPARSALRRRSTPAPAAASAAMNVNKASASDMILFLGLKKDEADRIVTNRPYRVKGELVAKNVVPKETFDMIKDRISVSP